VCTASHARLGHLGVHVTAADIDVPDRPAIAAPVYGVYVYTSVRERVAISDRHDLELLDEGDCQEQHDCGVRGESRRPAGPPFLD